MQSLDFKRRITLPLLAVITGILVFLGWYTSWTILNLSRTNRQEALQRETELVADFFSSQVVDGNLKECRKLVDRMAESLSPRTRLVVVDMAGEILADSQTEMKNDGKVSDSQEIRSALRGIPASYSRLSSAGEEESLFVAMPLRINNKIIGAVRMERPVKPKDGSIEGIMEHLFLIIAAAGIMAMTVIFILARHLTRPLYAIQRGIRDFARGDLEVRVPVFPNRPFNGMAHTMNEMARRLSESMQTVKQQRNEVEAVLSSMAEGVLAIDEQERIFRINKAAADMLTVRQSEVLGKNLQSTVRNSDIQHLLAESLCQDEPVTGDVTIYEWPEKYFQITSSVIKNAAGRKIGAVAVFNDVTQMRKLENVRRDFVANVSHEIRTPVTSIQGFVETLRDGALDNRKDAEHFLDIIFRHTERLNAIINDLLTLARVENHDTGTALSFESQNLRKTLASAIQTIRSKADRKKIVVNLECQPDLSLKIHPVLFEQAIINMLDNAINYSNSGDTITVRVRLTDEETIVEVSDNGCGIASEHLPRIFERFYRVDKGRSRELGGTGLGLAILKHVAAIHGGHVSVDSELNRGSTFRIHIPRF